MKVSLVKDMSVQSFIIIITISVIDVDVRSVFPCLKQMLDKSVSQFIIKLKSLLSSLLYSHCIELFISEGFEDDAEVLKAVTLALTLIVVDDDGTVSLPPHRCLVWVLVMLLLFHLSFF